MDVGYAARVVGDVVEEPEFLERGEDVGGERERVLREVGLEGV